MNRYFFTLFLILSFFTADAQDLIERTKLGIPSNLGGLSLGKF